LSSVGIIKSQRYVFPSHLPCNLKDCEGLDKTIEMEIPKTAKEGILTMMIYGVREYEGIKRVFSQFVEFEVSHSEGDAGELRYVSVNEETDLQNLTHTVTVTIDGLNRFSQVSLSALESSFYRSRSESPLVCKFLPYPRKLLPSDDPNEVMKPAHKLGFGFDIVSNVEILKKGGIHTYEYFEKHVDSFDPKLRKTWNDNETYVFQKTFDMLNYATMGSDLY